MYSQGKFGRAGGRGQGRMVAPSQAEAAAATPIAPRSRPGILPAPKNSNGNGNRKVKGAGAAAPVAPAVQNGTEEVFSLRPRNAQPFAMLLKLPPGLGLVEEVKRAEAEGANVQIKFGPLSHNVSGNVIDVGGKEFRFTWAPEPGELCDIYEERQSGEDGNGVLVESGAAWRKLNVQPTLNESARDRVKMSSAEAERQQKSRKAIILDHGNPVVKNQPKPVTVASNDCNTRKLLVKTKKEPPPKKRKIEGSSAALGSDAVAKPVVSQPIHSSAPKSATSPVVPQSEHPITLPQPTSMQGTSGTHFSKGHANTDGVVNRRHSSKGDVGKQKDKISNLVSMPVSEGGNQKSGVSSTPTDLRNLLITQLTENPKGMTIKAIEKAIGVSGKKIEPMIKTIATYQAPGRYFLKPGVEKESSMKLSSGSGSSPECQPNESPFVDSSPLSEKAGEPTDEQQVHSTPTQDSDLNIVDEIDDHLHESPDAPANQKNTINSDGSSSSSSSDSGSDSESDTGSSDSGSESGSSSDTESEVSSSSSEESDEVDIMGEEETEQKLRDSKATSSHVGRDGSGESFEQKCMIEDIRNVSPRNSEEVDICDDMGDGEGISDIAKHYVEKITSDGEDDVDMAVDIESETKTPEAKINISPKHGKQEDNHSPIAIGVSLQETKDKRNEVKENQIEETAQKSEKMPKSIYKHGYDKNQAQTGYDKYRSKQENKTRIEKKEGVDAETKRNRDVSSQSRFESPARPELSPSKKDFETRQFPKEINKSRFTDTNLERASEQATPLGRSRVPSTAEAQIGPTKDLDFERFDPHTDGQQSHQRSSEADSRAKVTDVVQRPGRYADHKISKSHDRASRQVTESDISAPKSSNIEEKNSRYEITFRTASEEDAVAKEKSNNSLRNSKENEYAERHSRTSESQGKRGGDQNGWHSRDVGSSGQLFMRNTLKDTKKSDIDKHHFPSGKESVLKREYSDLELGEFREPLSEEEPQESKTRFEKLQAGRHSAEAKAKNGSKRESASPDMAKGCLSGKAASELKKVSPSEPLEDINKHNGWIGKRMSEDGMQDLMRPKKSRQSPFTDHTDLQDLMRPKKSRQSPFADHADLDPLTIQEKMTDMAVKATTNETMKTSPRRGMETQPGAAYRSTSTNGLQKPEYKARVQEVIAGESKNNLQNIKGNAKSDEKRKENSRRENNLIPVRKKFGSSDEGNPFYAKYEKDKPELREQIKNLSQYKEYISEFQEKYECYQQLNTALESDMKDFQKLGRDLQSAEDRGDTKSCANISEQVKEAFSQCSRRHKRMKKVFVLLHEELKILKQRITEFAARYTPQK